MNPERVHTMSYESLICDPTAELDRLGGYLQMDLPGACATAVSRPSATSSEGVQSRDPDKQVRRWRDRLTPQQIDNVLNLTHRFGLKFYGEEPHAVGPFEIGDTPLLPVSAI